MSKIVESRLTDVTREQDWVAALRGVFGSGAVRVAGEDPIEIVGYNGARREVHVAVDRAAAGASFCDVGYRREADRLVQVADDLDLGNPTVKGKLAQARILYREIGIRREAARRGYGYRAAHQSDGSVVIEVTR